MFMNVVEHEKKQRVLFYGATYCSFATVIYLPMALRSRVVKN